MKSTNSYPFRLGQQGSYNGFLVTITDFEDGVFTLETPHGSKIKTGFVWLLSDWSGFTPEEADRFREYYLDAAWQNTNDKNGDA